MSELILIVDDEHDLVNTLAYNLEREGLRTRVALNAQAGLDGAMLDPIPDLILLDLMLPDFPGTEVCKQLKALSSRDAWQFFMIQRRGQDFACLHYKYIAGGSLGQFVAVIE